MSSNKSGKQGGSQTGSTTGRAAKSKPPAKGGFNSPNKDWMSKAFPGGKPRKTGQRGQ